MRISKNWLSDYVDLEDVSPDAFEELITTKVAEVDDIEVVGLPLTDGLIVKVTAIKPHPTREGVQIATVHDGKTSIELVCGAPNLLLNSCAAYLPPGSKFSKGVEHQFQGEVTAKQFSGVESLGFLASESELGITDDSSGILLLAGLADSLHGENISHAVGTPDVVIVIDNKSLTHRPDLWSHFGFARELSAILGRPLKINIDELSDASSAGAERLRALSNKPSHYKISIEADSRCPRFSAIELTGLQVGPSPLWIRRRLAAVGAGVRNQLVDLSNYVMCDIGQPNHTYDADRLSGTEIFVRRAKEGERFRGLDNEERTLAGDEIVIADAHRAIALGGVIGGAESAISDSTKRVLLESANFDPVAIRQVTKRHALRTDASNRFEKSQSPYAVPLALQRYCQLLTQLQPAVEVSSWQ